MGIELKKELSKTIEILARFVLDILVGIIFLGLIGTAALVIGLFVKWLESFGILPSFLIKGMTLLEYGLFCADVICFGFLVVMSAYKLVIEIVREYK